MKIGRAQPQAVRWLGDVAAKFRDFGWYTQEINGHDTEAIDAAVINAKANHGGRPCMIVLDTVKGHGWSAAEGKTSSHSMPVSDDQYNQAEAEIRARMPKL